MAEYLGSFDVAGTDISIPAVNKGKLAYLAKQKIALTQEVAPERAHLVGKARPAAS